MRRVDGEKRVGGMMTADFLLELRSEEIPARMQDKAREDLARLFATELAKAGLTAAALETYATPRRLTLIARDLPLQTEAVAEETKGPKSSAPPQALEGFLRKTGLTREQLIERDGVLFAIIERAGRATADVLAEAIPAIIRAFPWPKSMRWGDASATTESLKWVRPLQGIVALLGDDVVQCEIAGIHSGAATVGHRFHHPGIITIGSAADYVEKLPVLYLEFAEAAKFSGGDSPKSIAFRSAEELMRNTPGFWQHYVLPKIEKDFGALHRFLTDPFPDGPNFYLDAIEANIAKLRGLVVTASV